MLSRDAQSDSVGQPIARPGSAILEGTVGFMAPSLEYDTIRTVTRRLIPYLCLAYFVSFLDRVNIGFAALTMNKDLGLTATTFGFATGVFFIGYVLFELPSNLALQRYGARIWLARIMITWGFLSGATAFVRDDRSLYVLRFFLGAAEAGFLPGVVLYLTHWFPTSHRARIMGLFMLAIAFSGLVGAPLSGALLMLDGAWGLKGWQWIFLIEAVPAVILGVAALRFLIDRPLDAAWLAPAQRRWLQGVLDREERERAAVHSPFLGPTLRNPRVWALGLVNFGLLVGLYTISFWLPQIIRESGVSSPVAIGALAAVPALVGALGMIVWSRHSDRSGERTWHLVGSMLIGIAGFSASALVADPALGLVCLVMASLGVHSALPLFWTLPTAFLNGAGAAGGLALVNSISNLGGYVGPQLLGLIRDRAHTFAPALLAVAGLMLIAACVVAVLGASGLPVHGYGRVRKQPRVPDI